MRAILAEQHLNLLDRLAGCLRVCEPALGGCAETQDAEDDEDLPCNVSEARWDEQTKCEVEEPVADCGDAHTRGSRFKGPDLRSIDPSHRCKSQGVDDDQHVRERNDGVSWRARYSDDDVQIPVDAARDQFTVRAEDTADDKVADTHTDGTVKEQRSATSSVDEKEDGTCEHDEESILDPRRYEKDVAGQIGHLEDVDHVVSL